MRYRVYFDNGQELLISEERYRHAFEGNNPKTFDEFVLQNKWPYIEMTKVNCIVPEEEPKQGGVVKPLTPKEVRDQTKKTHDTKVSDPNVILSRIKEKNKDEGTDDN